MQDTRSMWAIWFGDDEDRSLLWQQVQRPVVGPGQVLVRVFATALNRADLLQRRGLYPPPAGASEIMGLEMAGVIAELGPGVTRWKRGDRVCALLEGGGYAQYALVDEGMLLPVPDGLSLTQAAALPEALYTAFLNLVVEAEMQTGESVLVHAGLLASEPSRFRCAKLWEIPSSPRRALQRWNLSVSRARPRCGIAWSRSFCKLWRSLFQEWTSFSML